MEDDEDEYLSVDEGASSNVPAEGSSFDDDVEDDGEDDIL